MDEQDSRFPPRAMTESEAEEDAHRGKEFARVLYPREADRLDLMSYVARYKGPDPYWYDVYPFAAYLGRTEQGHKILALAKSDPSSTIDGKAKFDWEAAMSDALIQITEQHTVSLGGGKGRAEGVELGKSNPPMPQRSRWGFKRRGEP